ncbi:hypothetical protein Pcinc_042285 [Petrolisthes cinctipes]|uniref:Uncharacterized protein n=1 Tax=Petrolisthes cinctipes TaxID=88211 RepID=A0AAE1EH55_PETCI|nr:hypothetical protein Pcinc_042285 [Petrolisthes cinctipes]
MISDKTPASTGGEVLCYASLPGCIQDSDQHLVSLPHLHSGLTQRLPMHTCDDEGRSFAWEELTDQEAHRESKEDPPRAPQLPQWLTDLATYPAPPQRPPASWPQCRGFLLTAQHCTPGRY